MKKIDKNNWFTEGCLILRTEDFSKITIDNLCTRLQVTKGSFYHHFKNTDEYVRRLMEYWLNENTVSFIEQTEQGTSLEEKNKRLYALVAQAHQKLELTIRAWGYSNAIVSEYVQKVDSMRLEYLTNMGVDEGYDSAKARDMALLKYATLIGVQQLCPNISEQEMKRLQQYI